MAESIRVQMSKETIDELTHLSEVHGCTYNGKPSFSKLLNKIGEKKLSVKSTELEVKEEKNPLLLISMDTPHNLTGIVATIVREIDRCNGKIIRAEVKLKRKNLGNLKICLSLPSKWENGFISKLVNSVNIDFRSLKDFGNSASQKLEAYSLLVEEGKTKSLEGDIIGKLDDSDINIIINLSLIFGLRLIVDPKSKAIIYFTKEVAKKGVLISSIKQDFSHDQKKEAIDFFLEIKIDTSNTEEINEAVNTITFLQDCEGNNGIFNVEYLAFTKTIADELFAY
jgi:hypothetical protein